MSSFFKFIKKPLFWLVFVTLAPLVWAFVAYYWLTPQTKLHFGEFAQVQNNVHDLPIQEAAGQNLTQPSWPSNWSLLSIGPATCRDVCLNRLYWQRQIISSLGRDQNLVTGIWLILGEQKLDTLLLNNKKHLQFWRTMPELLLQKLLPARGRQLEDDYYLIDGKGNWIMRFPSVQNEQDAAKLKKDLLQLLKVDKIWQRYNVAK